MTPEVAVKLIDHLTDNLENLEGYPVQSKQILGKSFDFSKFPETSRKELLREWAALKTILRERFKEYQDPF